MAHLTLPDPGGRCHDVHTYRALQLLSGRVDDLRELVVLARAVAFVGDVPLPEAGPTAITHGLTAGKFYVRLQ